MLMYFVNGADAEPELSNILKEGEEKYYYALVMRSQVEKTAFLFFTSNYKYCTPIVMAPKYTVL